MLRRIPLFIIACFFWMQAFADESILIRLNRSYLLPQVPITAFSGNYVGTISLVVPSPEITVAVFIDTLTAEEIEEIKRNLEEVYTAVERKGNLFFLFVTSEGSQWEGPFLTRNHLQRTLSSMPKPPEDQNPADADDAASGFAQLGRFTELPGRWSSFLVIGRFPVPDPSLRDYVIAYLSSHFRTMKVRVSYWVPGEKDTSIFDVISNETGGVAALQKPADLAIAKNDPSVTWAELKWENPAIQSGFHLYQAHVKDERLQGKPFHFSSFAMSPGFTLPSFPDYRILRDRAAALSELQQKDSIKPEEMDSVRRILKDALAVNPADREALNAAADIFERARLFNESAVYLERACELDPANADLFARLGNNYFQARNNPAAEIALKHAWDLGSGKPHILKELGQIAIANGDDRKALSFFEKNLDAHPEDAETWFMRADVANRLKSWAREIDSLEHGLSIDPGQLKYRTDLVRRYIEQKEYEKALYHIRPVLENPPHDAGVCKNYAEFLEQINQYDAALNLWKRVLEIDSGIEAAHYGVAHLLFDKGDFPGCIRAAGEGIVHAPASARLYLFKHKAEENLGLWYDARRTLQNGASAVEDVDLLRRYAESEEQYAQDSGQAYRKAVTACGKSDKSRQRCMALLDRGFIVSLRDGNRKSAEWFAARLRSKGRSDAVAMLTERTSDESELRIPGGIEAISHLWGEKGNISKQNFLEDFSKSLLRSAGDNNARDRLYQNISRHFSVLNELAGFSRQEKSRMDVSLSVSNSDEIKQTREVLKILGWGVDNNLKIHPAQGTSAAYRRKIAGSLGLDETAMRHALGAAQSFTFEIVHDWVPVALGESIWKESFYGEKDYSGGFLQALVGDLDLARLYIVMSELDTAAAEQLVKNFGMKILHDKYVDVLFEHSASLVVRNGHAGVPGGSQAEDVWERIVGVSPSNYPQFFKELISKDDGKMLLFFSYLMQLDARRQNYFTAYLTRTKNYYELFRESPEMTSRDRRDNPFRNFISEVPIDAEGHIRFPGSARLWMVAEGQSGSDGHVGKLMEKVGSIASQDSDDAILWRIMRTDYSVGGEDLSELKNFMAVVRVDAHRRELLDEASALLLAQQYWYHRALWPYVTTLTGLSIREYTQLFRLESGIRKLDIVTINDVLGEFHAVTKLICLLQEFKKIDEKQAATIFGVFCERLNQATETKAFASASLQTVRELITAAGISEADPDAAIRDLLIGIKTDATDSQRREREYGRILESQKVPSLKTAFGLLDAAARLASPRGDLSEPIKQLNRHLSAIPDLDFSKSKGLKGNAKDSLLRFRLNKIRDLARNINKTASQKRPSHKKLKSFSLELIEELNPQVRLALTGILYAYYFRPTDSLVMIDPLFLRKHQFIRLDPPRNASVYSFTDLASHEHGEYYLVGGFGDFGKTAGVIGMASPGNIPDMARKFAVSVLGSIRDTNWRALTDRDLRIVGLRVRAAREWVLRSATNTDAWNELSDSLQGLVSAGRRAKILRAVSRFQWDSTWRLLSVGDLYFLGEDYLKRFGEEPENSPTIRALRELSAGGEFENMRWMGPLLNSIYEYGSCYLQRMPPCENYGGDPSSDKLVERSNEFKLYLAELSDRAGIPASRLAAIAEPMAVRLFSEVNMTGSVDWESIITAYENMNENWFDPATGEN